MSVAKKLTIDDKIEIIETFENRNMDIEELLKKFDITDTQLHGILKNKEIIEEIWKHEVNEDQKKKERVTVYEEINETLYSWFLTAKARNMPLSGPILQEKAKEIAKELGTVEFKASNGWLQGFKKRKGISFSRRIAPIPMYTSTPKVEILDSSYQENEQQDELDHSGFYMDQIENLKMYNLRPVNPNMHTKRVVKNDADSSSINDHSDSSNSSSTGVHRNSKITTGSLVSVKKNDTSASTSPQYQNCSPEPNSNDSMPNLLKHSSNPDMPRIKYYGSLRNNSNFSKMSGGTISNHTTTTTTNNTNGNNISNNSNGPMTRLRRSTTEAQNSTNISNLQQKRPSLVIESKKVSIGNNALTQRNSTNNSNNNSGSLKNSTMIDLSSDEENERKDKLVSIPNKKQKVNGPDLSSQYGIPILDFSHEDTIRKCSQNGITAFIPLKALNSNEPSELCLPLIQVKDFEKKRFLFSTNRFLRIGTIKSVNK